MTLSPGDKPLFIKGQVSDEYPGESEPIFDEELIPPAPPPAPLPELEVDEDTGEIIGELPPLEPKVALPVAAPSRGYEVRRRMIGELHARGYTNNQIGKYLGYSPGGVSNALKDPFVQAVAAAERESLVDTTATDIIKRTSVHAAQRLERKVLDPESRNGDQISQFILEKVTGKAVQAIQHESGSLLQYLEILRSMQSRGEAVDVTPPDRQLVASEDSPQDGPADQWSDWVDKNL